jgi:hypothetical protein
MPIPYRETKHWHTPEPHDHTGIASPTNLVWDDLRCSLHTGTVAASAPSLTNIRDGLYSYAFSATLDNAVHFDVQLPHGWAVGTSIYPHIHWSNGASTSGGVTRWALEYAWANMTAAFGASTTLTVDATTPTTAYTHTLTSFGAITGTGKTDSSVLICRIARLGSHGNDTNTAVAFGLSVDFHIQLDSMGDVTQP